MPDTATVHIYDDGVLLGSPTVDGVGNWALNNANITAGMSAITAKGEDAAGNLSAQTQKKIYTGSTTKPSCDLLDDTGQSSTDNLTNDNTPRVRVLVGLDAEKTDLGIAVASASVASLILEHSSNGGTTWTQLEANTTPTFDGAALFEFTHQITTGLADGDHLFRAAWKDAKGNQSGWGTTLTVTVDTTAPNVPAITSISDGQVFVGTAVDVSGTAA